MNEPTMPVSHQTPEFFWLHIKKAGGQSMRAALSPSYTEANRKDPAPFRVLPPEQWNDNLNNYRVPLGDYDNRRTLFAKRFLWPDRFDGMYKFCIVRNPFDRIVSAYRYLTPDCWRALVPWLRHRVTLASFLDFLPELWERKLDRHLLTHTAPVWPDVSGEDGESLMDYIGKLENLQEAVEEISQHVYMSSDMPRINASKRRAGYRKYFSSGARRKVEQLFADDINRFDYDF
jgi:hypothetical protein